MNITSFSSDIQASIFKQTYINGFLDCSGSMMNRNGSMILGDTTLPGFDINKRMLTMNSTRIALACFAGETGQAVGTVALGQGAGQLNQNMSSVAIGIYAAQQNQLTQSVAIGPYAGQLSQGTQSVALGYLAGQTSQGGNSLALGTFAGLTSQGSRSVAIGSSCGSGSQGGNSVALGYSAGSSSQGSGSVALGYQAGQTSQGANSVAIGSNAGFNQTGQFNTFVGTNAGWDFGVTRIGQYNTYVGVNTTATGNFSKSTAIGYSATITASNQIVIGTATENILIPGNTTGKSFTTTSDYRVKEDIHPLDPTYSIDSIRPVQYKLKGSDGLHIGVIAHELQESLPFLVHGVKDGPETQSVNYTGLIGLLVKEVQDLKREVKQLKCDIEGLRRPV